MTFDLEHQDWYSYLSPVQKQLLETSLTLLDHAREVAVPDYGYLIFPAAKAYEGILKKYLYDVGLLDQKAYQDKKFRIGRALNPDIRNSHQDEDWYYDDVAQVCGEPMAREIWDTWLECRNHIFHFFPGEDEIVTLDHAQTKIFQIMTTLQSLIACYNHSTKENHG